MLRPLKMNIAIYHSKHSISLEKCMPDALRLSEKQVGSCGPSTELQSDWKQMGLLGAILMEDKGRLFAERAFSIEGMTMRRFSLPWFAMRLLYQFASCTENIVHDRGWIVKTAFLYGKHKEEIYMNSQKALYEKPAQ